MHAGPMLGLPLPGSRRKLGVLRGWQALCPCRLLLRHLGRGPQGRHRKRGQRPGVVAMLSLRRDR